VPPLNQIAASWEMLTRAGLTHSRPDFGIREVMVAGERRAVTEQVVTGTVFGQLLRFRKEGDPPQPRVLVVAPLSGHFATLLRNTVEVLLPTTTSTSPTGSTPATRRWPTACSASTNMSTT